MAKEHTTLSGKDAVISSPRLSVMDGERNIYAVVPMFPPDRKGMRFRGPFILDYYFSF